MAKVVVHVDEAAKVAMAQGNVQNLLAALPTSEVIIVVNGPAITTLTTSDWSAFMSANPQVEVDACRNAMNSHQLVPADLVTGVQVVPAGVVRIVELQALGFAYLKP
ncbi:DsrE family protein [Lactiplantibacillus fabifermentans]|uniref:Sulfur reduction protein DsrE n=2 Tax=Lactiplantibacillus fabifermentans TaxID=483011 RepID=A0A0R2NUN1_9LACO|nr:DsrE family protein [Lactiplantibacillus fabifermentans]ETY73814.1 hypothetical protein LFAB_10175 [Lactiplantibacillus fabifermentans T30PCM01]KRO27571.1 hypothetical protein DY78_GL003089 [Lactiplantibacillus fabifermentans DSM 21115]